MNKTNFQRHNNFCVTPFIGIEIKSDGKITPCCLINTHKMKWPTIKDTTVEEAFQSEPFEQLREDFRNNLYNEACNACWNNENKGITSKRQKCVDGVEKNFTTDIYRKSKIKSLDLKLGIQCNLKCRICNKNQSSKWYTEDRKYLDVPPIQKLDYTIDMDNNFWIDKISNFNDLSCITMSGGEPLLDRTHIEMLERLLALGKKDTTIHYNTNGTIFPTKHLETLSKFDNVSFSFSIDNTGKRFEYERNGMSWDLVDSNLQKFAQLDRNKFFLDFHTTVSVFNILDLEDTLNYADNLNFTHELSVLYEPSYFSIENIPIHKRQEVIEYTDKSKHKRVREISQKLKQSTFSNLNKEFWQNIDAIDLRRNQNFLHTYPHIAKIMNK